MTEREPAAIEPTPPAEKKEEKKDEKKEEKKEGEPGVESRMVLYTGFGHGINKPKSARALLQSNLALVSARSRCNATAPANWNRQNNELRHFVRIAF